jgi:hypothetical protein
MEGKLINNKIRQYGQILRMNDKIQKKLLNMNLKRKCRRARPELKWEQQSKRNIMWKNVGRN